MKLHRFWSPPEKIFSVTPGKIHYWPPMEKNPSIASRHVAVDSGKTLHVRTELELVQGNNSKFVKGRDFRFLCFLQLAIVC